MNLISVLTQKYAAERILIFSMNDSQLN